MAEVFGLMDKAAIIKQMPIFSSLNFFDRSIVAKSCALISFDASEVIYREDDPPNAFNCIVSGKVRLFVRSESGDKETIEYLGRGKYFGIISLLTGEPHSVSAEVINDAVILKIDKEEFDYLLKRIPRLALDLSQTLSRRLKRKNLHRKIIFESTIVSVYSPRKVIDKAFYSLNLSCSLKKETGKRVLFVSFNFKNGSEVDSFDFLKNRSSINLANIKSNVQGVKSAILDHGSGIDIIKIIHNKSAVEDANQIVPLLNFLTDDYHYIVVDLPFGKDETITKALTQSDLIHVISEARDSNLAESRNFIVELEKITKKTSDKLRLISLDLDKSCKEASSLGDEPYATLPRFPIKQHADGIVMHYPDTDYAKALRRISREIGGVTIGLALGCGAASGLAHIGVIKVLERENIPIDILVGSSMGSLIGAFWATGMTPKQIASIFVDEGEQITGSKLLDFTFPKLGLISGNKMEHFLRRYIGDKTFHDVKLPFKVMASNLKTKEEVTIDKGSIAKAVRTSISIPGIVAPVKFGDQYLLDGGILNPIPVGPLVRMGIGKIIAVNVLPILKERKGGLSFLAEKKDKDRKTIFGGLKKKIDKKLQKTFSPNIFDVIVGSLEAMEYVLAEQACQQADVVINPEIEPFGWFDFVSAQELIRLGEEEALKMLPEIKNMIK